MVTTTADQKLSKIITDLKKVEEDLLKWYLDDSEWGRSDYTQEYESRVQEALIGLRKIRKSID